MNSTFIEKHDRIKEERKRLGFTQEQAANKCGIRRQQWIRYEKGSSNLDGEPLRKFADSGANIGYILTGQRTASVTMVGRLQASEAQFNDDETNLVASFRKLSDKQRDAVLAMMEAFTS